MMRSVPHFSRSRWRRCGSRRNDRPDAESQGHHGNPRHHRIAGNHGNPAKNKHPLLVEHVPDASERAELRRLHGVQAVVQDDNGKARDGQYPPGQINERGQRDHRHAERAEHQEQHRVAHLEREVERQAHHGQLDQDQPGATRQQKPRELRLRGTGAIETKEGADASSEQKHRRADVGDPAREEQDRRRAGEILRRETHGARVEEITGVVERHDDHHRSAQRVDRGEARRGFGSIARRHYRRHGFAKRGSRSRLSSVSERRKAIRSARSSGVSEKPRILSLLLGLSRPTPLCGPSVRVRPPAS